MKLRNEEGWEEITDKKKNKTIQTSLDNRSDWWFFCVLFVAQWLTVIVFLLPVFLRLVQDPTLGKEKYQKCGCCQCIKQRTKCVCVCCLACLWSTMLSSTELMMQPMALISMYIIIHCQRHNGIFTTLDKRPHISECVPESLTLQSTFTCCWCLKWIQWSDKIHRSQP